MKNTSEDFNYLANREWEFEGNSEVINFIKDLTQSWEVPTICTILYLLMVFGGKRYMLHKPSYSLQTAMMIWSALLAIFSIVGTYRTCVVLTRIARDWSIKKAVCDWSVYDLPISRFWVAIFPFSKFLEYFDTAFIVLRKRNLIFLHWYHHLTVALFCWLCYGGQYSGGWFFMTLNYAVHSLMYSYYTLRAAGMKLPRIFPLIITSSQILQMIIGCWVMAAIVMWGNEPNCKTSTLFEVCGSVMYASYLILFLNFFRNSYLRRPKEKKQDRNYDHHVEQRINLPKASKGQNEAMSLRRRPRFVE